MVVWALSDVGMAKIKVRILCKTLATFLKNGFKSCMNIFNITHGFVQFVLSYRDNNAVAINIEIGKNAFGRWVKDVYCLTLLLELWIQGP